MQDTEPPVLVAYGSPAVVTLGTQTSGHFHLIYNGGTSAAINYDATSATVQSALTAVSQVGAGNATVTGAAGGPYTVTFVGARAGTLIPLEFDGSALGTPMLNDSVANWLQLVATDTRSGVLKICYTVDGGPVCTMWADPLHVSMGVAALGRRLQAEAMASRLALEAFP